MKKPALAVLAAGMGSRYGGLKQIDPVGPHGEVIIDYSIYDAVQAGFEKVVFIIKREIEAAFREAVGRRMEKNVEVAYAYQELNQLPPGYAVPEGRAKPWGTTHAIMAAAQAVNGPFAAINADDYYGPHAYRTIYGFLTAGHGGGKEHYAMVGYRIENTVTAHGAVARGICQADAGGYLTGVTERLKIEKTDAGARYTEDGGQSWADIPPGTLVSMNFWGFGPGILACARRDFAAFLDANLSKTPTTCEFLLPNYVGELVARGAADVKVLQSEDVWYGVTYKEDKPGVVAAIAEKHRRGLYPAPLWSNM